ncbi:MAG: hypothetical protein QOH29_2620 [Actinomycetota bacterium]|nr:hypothetical protein [Actinomycetota bacterium]
MTTLEQPVRSRLALILAIGATVFLGLIPGVGAILGFTFAYLGYPDDARTRRGFIILGIVMTVLSVVFAMVAFGIGSTESSSSQTVPA